MRTKRKAVSNDAAVDIPPQVSRHLDSESTCADGVSTSAPVHALGVMRAGPCRTVSVLPTSVQDTPRTSPTFCTPPAGSTSTNIPAVEASQGGMHYAVGKVVHDSYLLADNNSHVHVSLPVFPAGAQSVVAESPTFCGTTIDTSSRGMLTTGIDGQSDDNNRVRPLVSTVQHQLEVQHGQPAEVQTVDGSISTFQVINTVCPFQAVARQPAITEGDAHPSGYNSGIRTCAPMVLDFSTGHVLQDPNFNACRRDTYMDGPRVPVAARVTRQTGGHRSLRGRQRVLNGQPHVTNSHAPPMQGPVAPPQQQGAPSAYRCFGRCDQVCQHCGAFFWLEEKRTGLPLSARPQYQRCCVGGRVVLHTHEQCPAYIMQLFSDRHFMDNIRAYNQMFAMTSFGATVDSSINTGRGPYVFRVSGQIYHWIGAFCPVGDDIPRFLQLYIYDTDHEVQNRLSHFEVHERQALRQPIINGLIEFLDQNNALVKLFRTARDKLRETNIPNFTIRLFGVAGSSQYELPTADSIGAIVYEGGPETMTDYDVVIQRHSGEPESVNKLHPAYMALQFPLLFIYGGDGYHLKLTLTNPNGSDPEEEKKMSMKVYYAYQLCDRVRSYNLITRAGRLFQQYVVNAYCVIEQHRTDYIRQKQDDIRNEYLSGIYDAITRGDRDGRQVGSRIILPASFTGGPRYMYSHYLDALAICRVHGNPSFFVTFTCNVKWPEIQQYMNAFPLLTTSDRPDIVCRVFERKIHALIKFVREEKIFGQIVAVLYTVEFQKRGLPHCHILLWTHSHPTNVQEVNIDTYISAELPDHVTDPEGYRVVSELMMHGPCGRAYPSAPCTIGRDSCKKQFPKEYSDRTYTDAKGYVHYRRRDVGFGTYRRGVRLDNAYVVPYNRLLCMVFYAHINVEYCGWTMLIKYLFKYISKGTDRIVARVVRPIGERTQNASSCNGNTPFGTNSLLHIDEIKNFMDARYIGPHEACWRILGFDIHSREPAVQILTLHAENMQHIAFRASQRLTDIANNSHAKKTTLTEWLEFNRLHTIGRHLTYLQFPAEFVWSKTAREWSPRQNRNKPSIGRLTYVHPASGDLYFQRMLLCHQKGCALFSDIRKVDGYIHLTHRAACQAMGLLGDDQEWALALEEAAISASASELRALFVQILIFCDVAHPAALWEAHWVHMHDDIPGRLSELLNIPDLHVNETTLKGGILYELQAALAFYGKSLSSFSLPSPPENLLRILRNRLVMEELNYNRVALAEERDRLVPQLNQEQRAIFNRVTTAVSAGNQELLFVYGHGGTGKTFIWKAILCALRSEGRVVLAVASSGIASLLLPSGRTAHSRFKLSLNLTDHSVCNIKKNTQLAELLKRTDLIIWDEAPMNDRKCFEALDRTLRDVLDMPGRLFANKSIILGGDFRQTLPVKKNGSKSEIIASSVAESYLWRHFQIVVLHENMRLHTNSLAGSSSADVHAFSKWLLAVGNGAAGYADDTDPENTSWVKIPDQYCIRDTENGLAELVDFIYDRQTLEAPTAQTLQQKAIVCPKNETVDMINEKVLGIVHNEGRSYRSHDEATPKLNDGGATELLYPPEYLNTLELPSMPQHLLSLKIGVPIMLLRNLNLIGGLCNGTRLIVTQLLQRIIEARIITGTRVGQKVFLPRILLISNDDSIPFTFKRKQFPVKLCYAMTINKSQGQSLNKIGVYLPHNIFGHGQLYVALSRATSPGGLRVLITDTSNRQCNTTKNIVYKDFLAKIMVSLLLMSPAIILYAGHKQSESNHPMYYASP